MQCSSCEFENLEGMKFCQECGASLKSRCPQCGFSVALSLLPARSSVASVVRCLPPSLPPQFPVPSPTQPLISSTQPLAPKRRLKPKRVFSRQLRLPASSRQSPGNCVRQRAWLCCGNSKVNRPRLTICWQRFTIGSLKALTQRTCKRRRRCLRN
jgi:hypothetical protein